MDKSLIPHWEIVLPSQKEELSKILEGFGAETVNLQNMLHFSPWGNWRDGLGVRFWAWKFDDEPLQKAHAIVAVKGRYLVLPLWIHPATTDAIDALSVLLSKRTEANVSLMGSSEMNKQTESALLFAMPYQRVLYDFMVRPPQPVSKIDAVPEITCTVATGTNAFEAYPLQEAYEKEEVLFSPSEYQPIASRWNFQKSLKRELIILARHEGRPVAKGGTNARGLKWAQIGGVFTLPQWRGKGIQTYVMQVLIQSLAEQGFGTCLFVKKTNEAAKRLYRKLGFETIRDFEISYWQKEL